MVLGEEAMDAGESAQPSLFALAAVSSTVAAALIYKAEVK